MSKVYLLPARGAPVQAERIQSLWEQAGLAVALERNDLSAHKLHVGEPGCKTFVSPSLVASLVRCMAAAGSQPFLTDTAVPCRSPRQNAIGHTRVAHEYGFGLEQVGAHSYRPTV